MKPLPFLRIDKFLDEAVVEELLRFTIAAQPKFQKSGVIGDQSWRESVLLYAFEPYDVMMRERIAMIAPAALEALGGPRCRLDVVESQLTAHNDGNFFKSHFDSGSSDTEARRVSYVFYYHASPKPFSGGELAIFEGTPPDAPVHVIEPRRNSIVLFLSNSWHEVRETHVTSRAFEHSRFTINGWCRAAS